MSDRNLRWATVTKVSEDKGPHKMCEVECDGKKMIAFVGEVFGIQSVPHKGAQVVIGLLDGDEGKAVIMASMPRPKDRVDQQKEGEVSFKNHDTTNVIQHNEDGHTIVTTKADQRETIGDNQTTEVTGNKTTTVKKDQTTTVTSNQSTSVGASQSVNVGGNQTIKAGGAVKYNGALILLNC